jgi:hypothetical protein
MPILMLILVSCYPSHHPLGYRALRLGHVATANADALNFDRRV